jgi:hypothetical protein
VKYSVSTAWQVNEHSWHLLTAAEARFVLL